MLDLVIGSKQSNKNAVKTLLKSLNASKSRINYL